VSEQKPSALDGAGKVPETQDREETAAWFDSHDLTDYWDDLAPVQVRFAGNLSAGLHIRIDPATLAALREEAKRSGVGPATLARLWIVERLQRTGRSA